MFYGSKIYKNIKNGGRGGIRIHETLQTSACFQDKCHKPLGHSSVLVQATGIEPARITPTDPKSVAYAYFATLALLNKNGCGSRYRPWLNKVMSLARALCLPSATIF